MPDDWRITNQQAYLTGVTLVRKAFHATESNDHEHCEFCMTKFSEWPKDLKEGFCTLDGYTWICERCFQDFRQMFQWKVAR